MKTVELKVHTQEIPAITSKYQVVKIVQKKKFFVLRWLIWLFGRKIRGPKYRERFKQFVAVELKPEPVPPMSEEGKKLKQALTQRRTQPLELRPTATEEFELEALRRA